LLYFLQDLRQAAAAAAECLWLTAVFLLDILLSGCCAACRIYYSFDKLLLRLLGASGVRLFLFGYNIVWPLCCSWDLLQL
jgi:hypothetical protein